MELRTYLESLTVRHIKAIIKVFNKNIVIKVTKRKKGDLINEYTDAYKKFTGNESSMLSVEDIKFFNELRPMQYPKKAPEYDEAIKKLHKKPLERIEKQKEDEYYWDSYGMDKDANKKKEDLIDQLVDLTTARVEEQQKKPYVIKKNTIQKITEDLEDDDNYEDLEDLEDAQREYDEEHRKPNKYTAPGYVSAKKQYSPMKVAMLKLNRFNRNKPAELVEPPEPVQAVKPVKPYKSSYSKYKKEQSKRDTIG